MPAKSIPALGFLNLSEPQIVLLYFISILIG